jgi:hypothetical protein
MLSLNMYNAHMSEIHDCGHLYDSKKYKQLDEIL